MEAVKDGDVQPSPGPIHNMCRQSSFLNADQFVYSTFELNRPMCLLMEVPVLSNGILSFLLMRWQSLCWFFFCLVHV
jgi:hypothetical protein